MRTVKESAKAREAERARRGDTAPGVAELLPLSRVRDELGLEYDEFDVALQVGEVRTVVCGPGVWKVPRSELARLRALEGPEDGLLKRLRLVSSGGAAEAMGIGRDRFTRLARAGCVRPVRWYVNQYRAVVWLYLAREAAEFADLNPAVLTGRLPGPLRETGDGGTDLRARGWRARRAGQLVRDAADAWEEAAVWAALLGPQIAGEAVPDPYERAHLYRLRATLPAGRPGRATPEQVRSLTTADAPDEIAAALFALAEALGRARRGQPVPRPSPGSHAPALPALPALPAPPAPPAPHASPALPAPHAPEPPGLPEVTAVPPRPEVPPGQEAAPSGARPAAARRGLRRLLGRRPHTGTGTGQGAPAGPGRDGQSSPTSVTRTTARPSSSEAARSTSAEMPQP
ncbi:DUF6397 family protein [Actinacidiphila rubida]|uniref:Uncharacterized protein n=1 Tax=Actinacidiphila rubida TaxID=310780 RepID=A0A1H8JS61_9ACTN|nr:DUF6397 family protein [Actinacidiphila rubida]SEN83411.1 hypothetical protein SAMN05216267_101117 [Actinacidiphila rubida]